MLSEETLIPIMEAAKIMGLHDFLKAIRLLKLEEELERGNFTLFAPIDGTFDMSTDFVAGTPGVMLQVMI